MKRTFLAFLMTAICAGLIFSACKKSDDSKPADPEVTNAQVATQADDESMVSSEMDDAAADVNAVVESDVSLSGENAVVAEAVCDATVSINADSDPMTMTITYNGASCTTKHTRTGVVVVSMAKGSKWKDQGAHVDVSFQNFKVTRTADQKTITLDGSYRITNTTGKLLKNLATSGTIIHTLTSSNMSITLSADNSARTWNVARQYTYTFDNGAVLAINGLHTEGEVKNISEWGMNRFGNAFTTAIDSALVIKQGCDFRLTAGMVTHTTALYTASATFGLDATGAVTGCPAEGLSYYYLLVCTLKGGGHLSMVLPY